MSDKTAGNIHFLKSKWLAVVLLFFLYTAWNVLSVSAATTSEYKVKAAFILNFALLTEWPEHSFPTETSPIKLCVIGDRAVAQAFDSINGKKIGKRTLQVDKILPHDARTSCHIIFFSKNTNTKIVLQTLTNVSSAPVLTIGEKDTFINLGGEINFFMAQDRLRFGINTTAVENHNLRLSSRLLKIAVLTND